MLNDVIGKRIRECRLERGLTQENLADKLNLSHQLISKWENGIAAPSIEILFAIARLFDVSIDFLCGVEKSDMEKTISAIIEKCPYHDIRDYDSLYEGYVFLDTKMKAYPLNERLLAYSLEYLRWMHDMVYTDAQKDLVNAFISKNAQQLLDISKDDELRSIANYNMACYYLENVNMLEPSAEGRENAKKAKEYANKVLYKDMSIVFFNIFGAENQSEQQASFEKTLKELIDAMQCTIRNLQRTYTRQTAVQKSKNLNEFSKVFTEAAEKLMAAT